MTFGVEPFELNVERLNTMIRRTLAAKCRVAGIRHAPHGSSPNCRTPGRRPPDRRISDLDHLEVFFACAALRTGPVNGNVRPASARRNAFVRQTGFFVVNPAANQAHPALIFHSCVAS